MPSLHARLQRLEKHAEDTSLCADLQCKHMELLRLNRRVNGLPEYPLPPHAKNPTEGLSLVEVLQSLNRRQDETAEAYAERMRPKPYVDPFTGAAVAAKRPLPGQ